MTVLCYHTVESGWESPLAVRPEAFEQQAEWLARRRRVVDLPEAKRRFDGRGQLPPGWALLTFDDGFDGVYHHAFPVLRRLGLPATVYVVTRTLHDRETPVDWVREDVVPRDLRCLDRDQILEMRAAGIRFGSHTVTHRDLPELTFAEQLQELRQSREALEDLLGERIDTVAYPRGHHDRVTREAARSAGYFVAFSLPERREPVGPLAVPRTGIYRVNTLRGLRVKTQPGYLRLRLAGTSPQSRRRVAGLLRLRR
ncbi:polysaccharide deacetylase family protein [Egicoccus sp. AB-alg2]|uniref:polysaccharide deacetylase family protein n=1 Tax=Egicoccus sp. AB-alg2 TaxID=3242693 RepID=UPI00359F09DC